MYEEVLFVHLLVQKEKKKRSQLPRMTDNSISFILHTPEKFYPGAFFQTRRKLNTGNRAIKH